MMNLSSGIPVVVQQYRGLLKKKVLVSWRNKRATFLQVSSSLLFMFIMFGIQQAMEARSYSSSIINPKQPLLSPPIPPCDSKHHLHRPCFDFVWSGNDTATVRTIVAAIMANNPRRRIPSTKVFIYAIITTSCLVFICRLFLCSRLIIILKSLWS